MFRGANKKFIQLLRIIRIAGAKAASAWREGRGLLMLNGGYVAENTMANRFTSIWNEKKPAVKAVRPAGRAGVASGSADAESGDEGGDSAAQSLRALKVMLDRGLMTQAEYDERKAAITGNAAE
jgi:hypothetical protein